MRDGRDPASELAIVEAQPTTVSANLEGPAEKPPMVLASPNLSVRWDELIGDGSAYKPQDVPLLTQWVWWTELAIQLSRKMLSEGGEIQTLADQWRGGNQVEVETPTLKQMQRATDMSLKLAEHFGGTPMARARLGLTRAATASIGEDIRLKVISAMREAGQ